MQRVRMIGTHVFSDVETVATSESGEPGTLHQQLASEVQHGPLAPGQSKHLIDNYANRWSVGPGGRLCATAPGRSHELVTSIEEHGVVVDFAVDDNGYVWSTDGERALRRLNPRGPHYGPPGGGGGVEFSAPTSDHLIWQTFADDQLPPGKIASLTSSSTRDCAIVTMDTGAQVEVSIEAGVSSAGAVPPAPTGPRWEAAGGRLPCGNHDIYAAECNGRVYVSGGALWYRGFPARAAEFDEVWKLHPNKLDDADGEREVTSVCLRYSLSLLESAHQLCKFVYTTYG